MTRTQRLLLAAAALLLGPGCKTALHADTTLDRIRLPAGFSIALYASGVEDARSMTIAPSGTLFVGTRTAGKVYAIPRRSDGSAGPVTTIAERLAAPNGVAFRDGALYVAEINRILRFPDIESRLNDPPKPEVVADDLPSEMHHGFRVIRFGPDGMLYVPIGAPCNVCEKYGVITRSKVGGKREVFARGVRNSVGYDWHPETRDLWFTDNGRDLLGDDTPPDELDRAPKASMHFGFPFCHGGDVPDPELGRERSCGEFAPPAIKLGPHVAALGMRFYTGRLFPEAYRNRIFIAEHGSWNRTQKIGYRVTMVTLEGNRAVHYEPFAEGWLDRGAVTGRPVDVEIAPDGSLLVSDDAADAIYRIRYDGPRK